jgi:exonuclease III
MNIAAQNLRGLGTTQDKLEDITREMDENNIHVLMITETWCGNRDEGRLDSGYLLLTSGIGRRSGCRGTQGVGFILSPQLAQQYEESGRQFCGHGGRLATLRLPLPQQGNTDDTELYLVVAYAPVSTAGTTQRRIFHDDLDLLMDKSRQNEVMLVGGDFNAALGGPSPHDNVCGQHASAHTNTAGTELRGLLVLHGLFSPVTCFNSQYKGSWTHMRSKKQHQLDHIFMAHTEKNRVRKCRYSHMLADSDHFSVRLQLSLGLQRKRKMKTTRQLNGAKDYDSRFGPNLPAEDRESTCRQIAEAYHRNTTATTTAV